MGTSWASLKASELDALLCWHGVPAGQVTTIKPNMEKWVLICQNAPPPFEKWTDADEEALRSLKEKEIVMEDTAVGRLQAVRQRELEAVIPHLLADQLIGLETKIADRLSS